MRPSRVLDIAIVAIGIGVAFASLAIPLAQFLRDQTEPVCPACRNTGFTDYAGFSMDPCGCLKETGHG